MAGKMRRSAVQNIIKNLLESEIPEIQTASKELAEWIRLLEQHSFKLQHYATEIESWASEEEEVDSIELTDLIKDLESTLNDMRQASGTLHTPRLTAPAQEEDKANRSYGRAGRVLPEPRGIPRAEIKEDDNRVPARKPEQEVAPEIPDKQEPERTPQGVLMAKDSEKSKAKPELPTGSRDLAVRKEVRPPAESDGGLESFTTPEGFRIKRMRP